MAETGGKNPELERVEQRIKSVMDKMSKLNEELRELEGRRNELSAKSAPVATGEAVSKQVLVVEDDQTNLIFLTKVISKIGHTVLQANSGEYALELVKSEECDLVVCDINLPGMNGLTLVSKIREHPNMANVPVVMCTSSKDKNHILAAAKLKVAGYLLKPLDRARIVDEVQSALIGAGG